MMVNPPPPHPHPRGSSSGAHRFPPRSAPPAAHRRSASRGSPLWTPRMNRSPSTSRGQFYLSLGGQFRMSLDTQGSPAVPVGMEVFMDIGPILDTGEGSTQD